MNTPLGPHFEIPSSALAAWVEAQGVDQWWNVDGDPVLTGEESFPCPGDELAQVLRRLDRPLLVQAPRDRIDARGQVIQKEDLDSLAYARGLDSDDKSPKPAWVDDRYFACCWKGSETVWLLIEDHESTRISRRDELAASAGE